MDDPRFPMDNNSSERLERGPAVVRKNFYGSGSLWSGQLMAALFSIWASCAVEAQSPEMADVVLRALCGGRGQVSGGRAIVLCRGI